MLRKINRIMKNKCRKFFLLSGFMLVTAFGYGQDIMWEKSFGGRHAEYLADVQPTADYGFILAGSSLSKKSGSKSQEGAGDLDYLIWKMDESGSTEWQKSFGGSGSDLLKVIKNTYDGGFILGGVSNSEAGFSKKDGCFGNDDYWLIKLDAKGNELWQRVYGGKGKDDLTSVIATSDGGYLIGGSSSSSVGQNQIALGGKKEINRGSMDYWIIKIDASGNEEWQRTYGGKYADVLQSMVVTKDGGYLIGGNSNSPASKDKISEHLGGGNDFWLLKLDALGAVEWQQSLGGAGEDNLTVVYQTTDGSYIAAGNSNSTTRTTKNGSDLWIVKLHSDGTFLWEKSFDIGKNDILMSLITDEDGSFMIGAYSPSGYQQSNKTTGINDYIALKVSALGEELWRKECGSKGEDVLKQLIETRDGGYLMVGTSNPEFNGYTPRNKSSINPTTLSPINSSEQLAGAKKLQEGMDAEVNKYSTAFNSAVNDQTTALFDQVNEKIDTHNTTNFKVGINGPVGNLLNPTKSSSGKDTRAALEELGPKAGTKISRDKTVNYGGKDFWVVKLKDRSRKLKEKTAIEAYPNPTISYTNVIIGFDFDLGSVAVYDLGGRKLQNWTIDSRTVSVNLSSYPSGIYIIQIKTNKGEESVKIIKE